VGAICGAWQMLVRENLNAVKIIPILFVLQLLVVCSSIFADDKIEFRLNSANKFFDVEIGGVGRRKEGDLTRDRRIIRKDRGSIFVLDNNSQPLTYASLTLACKEAFAPPEYFWNYCGSSAPDNSIESIKKRFGDDLLVRVCDSEIHDPSQTPKAYYHKIFKEYWGVDEDGRVKFVGITKDLWAIPLTEALPQACVDNERTISLQTERRNRREAELRIERQKQEAQQRIDEEKKNNLISAVHALRKSPWSSFEYFTRVLSSGSQVVTEYFFDPKSTQRRGSALRVLTLSRNDLLVSHEQSGLFRFSGAAIYELHCMDETYRFFGEVIFLDPVQAGKVHKVNLPTDDKWRYIPRDTEVHRLFQNICM